MRLTQLVLGLSLVACRGTGGGGDDTPDVDGPIGGSVRVQDVQDEGMPVGTVVELKGVIVTAIDAFGARTGDLWVQDPAGGEFSGIKVFGAPLEQIASLSPGDIVTISNAEKDEFALSADTSGKTVTEVKPAGGGAMLVTKTGTGPLPSPATVDAKAIEEMTDQAARDAEWEKWEGVYINVTNIRQTSAYAPFSSTSMNPDQFEFSATAGLAVQSVLADLGSPVVGTCYSGITGIGDYFFNYLLLPTSASGLTAGGTGCALQTTATVAGVQSGGVTGDVAFENVFITARDDIGSKGVWVADSLQGAASNGVFVFTGGGTSTLDPALAVGAKVNVIGKTKEFDVGTPPAGDTVTEIENATVTLMEAPSTMPTPMVTTANVASDMNSGEALEGVFVSISTVKVTNAALGNGKIELTDNNGNKIVVDDDLFATGTFPVQTVGQCKNLVGVMHLQLNDNIRTLLPRSGADITAGTGCTP